MNRWFPTATFLILLLGVLPWAAAACAASAGCPMKSGASACCRGGGPMLQEAKDCCGELARAPETAPCEVARAQREGFSLPRPSRESALICSGTPAENLPVIDSGAGRQPLFAPLLI
jgi:hypothetical protein